MARLTHDQYKQLIADFVWNNLNKEITGPVLRQFIDNILDSTSEMKMRSGKTIEQVVEELKNAVPDGSGSAIQFSNQFAIIDDIVNMNISFITANDEDDMPESPYPLPANPFEIKTTDTDILNWDATRYSTVKPEDGQLNVHAELDWQGEHVRRSIYPISIPLGTDFLNSVNSAGGDYLYVDFEFAFSDLDVSGNLAGMKPLCTMKLDTGVSTVYRSSSGELLSEMDKGASNWNRAVFRVEHENYDLLSPVIVGFYIPLNDDYTTRVIPAGAWFYYKNLKIYRNII